MPVVKPEPFFDLEGEEVGTQYRGDAFTLFVGTDGLLVLEGNEYTLDDLQQLNTVLDRVLGGATLAGE